MKHAVITGITSFVGISLSSLLSEKGVDITGIVRPGSSRKDTVSSMSGVSVIERDLSDIEALRDTISHADCFFHVGWNSSFPNSRYNVKQSINVDNTISAVHLAYKIGCNTFIGVGSQAECGRVSRKIDENTPNSPENEYGRAKARSVEESTMLCGDYHIRCMWPRLLSAYGPFDRPHTLIMSYINSCLNDKCVELTPCGQIWDYIYIDDVANALLSIAERGKHGVRYPIGSGDERKLSEYVEIMADNLNRNTGTTGIGAKPYPADQPMYLGADISTLTKDTGFRPKTRFDVGIKKTIEWVKQHPSYLG